MENEGNSWPDPTWFEEHPDNSWCRRKQWKNMNRQYQSGQCQSQQLRLLQQHRYTTHNPLSFKQTDYYPTSSASVGKGSIQILSKTESEKPRDEVDSSSLTVNTSNQRAAPKKIESEKSQAEVCKKASENSSLVEKKCKEKCKKRKQREIKEVIYKCEICDKTFLQKHYLRYHERTIHGGKTFECEYCHKKYRTSKYRNKHKRKCDPSQRSKDAEPGVPEESFPCKVCGVHLISRANLESHEKKHNENQECYKCAYCEKSFITCQKKIYHERIHTGTHIYFQCELCGVTLTTKHSLDEHKRIHTGEKPFKCKSCDKYFSRENQAKDHERRMHTDPTLKCSFCERKFFSKHERAEHERIHTGEKPYKCDQCEMTFRTRMNVRNHFQRVHLKVVRHKCNYGCDKQFFAKSQLIVHERIHKGEKPYKCKQC